MVKSKGNLSPKESVLKVYPKAKAQWGKKGCKIKNGRKSVGATSSNEKDAWIDAFIQLPM